MKKATWIFTYAGGFAPMSEVVQADSFEEARVQFLAQVPQPCSTTKEYLLDGCLMSITRYANNRDLVEESKRVVK